MRIVHRDDDGLVVMVGAAPPAANPQRVADPPSYALHLAEAGTAILGYTRDREGAINVDTIDRLPAGLDDAADWLRQRFPKLPEIGEARVVIDADGLGRALWGLVAPRRGEPGRRGWRLYDRQGRDRQELVNALLVALSARRIRIEPSEHEDALRKAMASYRRTVGDDGRVGHEMVVALALAAATPPPRPALWCGSL